MATPPNLVLFNQIAEAVGGEGGHSYNLDALNEIASELIGSPQAFTRNLDALNAIAEHYIGSPQTFTRNIDALNAIAEAAGGDEETDTWTVDALTEWAAVAEPPNQILWRKGDPSTFTRPVTATYLDINGDEQTAAIDELRDAHYPEGETEPTTLLEDGAIPRTIYLTETFEVPTTGYENTIESYGGGTTKKITATDPLEGTQSLLLEYASGQGGIRFPIGESVDRLAFDFLWTAQSASADRQIVLITDSGNTKRAAIITHTRRLKIELASSTNQSGYTAAVPSSGDVVRVYGEIIKGATETTGFVAWAPIATPGLPDAGHANRVDYAPAGVQLSTTMDKFVFTISNTLSGGVKVDDLTLASAHE